MDEVPLLSLPVRDASRIIVSLCRDPCGGGPEDCQIEDCRADPQAGPLCIVARVRTSVPPHL